LRQQNGALPERVVRHFVRFVFPRLKKLLKRPCLAAEEAAKKALSRGSQPAEKASFR
jgi:hypothetical protein